MVLLVVGFVAAFGLFRGARWSRVRRGIGTYRWASETDGRLRRSDKAVLLVPIAAELCAYIWDRFARALQRFRRPLRATQWTVPTEPTTDMAKLMCDRWQQIVGVERDDAHDDRQAALRCLLNHSLRAWVFGQKLAERSGPQLDTDAFFLACLGHDLGLVDRQNGVETAACFTLLGANDIAWVGEQLPDEQARVTRAKEAIVHHITPGVSPVVDDELAVYVQQGSLCDLTRQRARLVREIDLDELCRTYPRAVESSSGRWIELGDIASELWPLESRLVPDGRARLLNIGNCFVRIVGAKPFGDGRSGEVS